jgi:hypothetical protein
MVWAVLSMIFAVIVWELLIFPLVQALVLLPTIALVNSLSKRESVNILLGHLLFPFLLGFFSLHVVLMIVMYIANYFDVTFIWWMSVIGFILSGLIILVAGAGYDPGSLNGQSFKARFLGAITYAIVYYVFL